MGESAYLENARRKAEEANSEYSLYSDVLAAVREGSDTLANVWSTWFEPTQGVQQQQTSPEGQAPPDESVDVLDSTKTAGMSQTTLLLIVGIAAVALAKL